MNCPNCLTTYNQGNNLPRILIGCGHTLCDYCIGLLFDRASLSISCPECFTPSSIQSPSQFPKNIALLNMSESSRKIQSDKDVEEPKLKEAHSQDQGVLDSGTFTQEKGEEFKEVKIAATLCKVHHKKIEAFCMKDKSLLCIDCILAEIHRAHKIESITKAFQIEKEVLYGSYNMAIDLEERLRSIMSDVERHLTLLTENAEQKRSEITYIFNEIRRVVHEKESTLKQSIAETLIKEEQEMQLKKKLLADHLRTVLKLKKTVELDVEREGHIEFLGNCRMREKLSKVAMQKIEEVRFRNPFPEVKREAEIAAIFRNLNPKVHFPSNVAPCSKKQGSSFYNYRGAGGQQKQSKGVGLQHQNSGTLKNQFKEKKEAQRTGPASKALIREFNQTSPATTKRNSEKYPSYFHIGAVSTAGSSSKNVKPAQNKAQKHSNSSVNTSMNKLQIRKVHTNIEDSEEGLMSVGIQSNRAVGNRQHCQPYNISPTGIDQAAFQSLTDRKRSGPIIDLPPSTVSPKRNVQNKKQGFPTRSEVTLTSNQDEDMMELGGPGGTECNTATNSTTNLMKLVAGGKNDSPGEMFEEGMGKMAGETQEDSFNRLMDDLRFRGEQRHERGEREQGVSVERVKWMKKTTLKEARAKAKLAKKGLNFTLEEALTRGGLKDERLESAESTFKRVIRQQSEDSRREESPQFVEERKRPSSDHNKSRVGVEPQSEEEEEDCRVGYEGKPNNSKASPETSKVKAAFKEPATDPNQRVRGCKQGKVIEVSLLSDEIRPETSSLTQQDMQTQVARFSDIVSNRQPLRPKELITSPLEEELKLALEEVKRREEESKTPKKGDEFRKDQVYSPLQIPLSPLKSLDNLKPSKSLDLSNSIIEEMQSPGENQSRDDLQSFLKSLNEKNTILVLSGYGSSKTVNQKYNIGKDYWQELEGLRLNRSKFAAVTLPSGSVLVIGGKKNEGKNVRLKSMEEFNPETETWITRELELPEPRSGMGAVIDQNGIIYLCGGNANGHISSTCLTIDIMNSTQWIQIPAMKCRRDEFALAIGPDRKIYAIGGFGGAERAPLKACERYDPETQQWEPIAPLNQARRALAGVCLPDGVYAIGGFDKTRSLASVERYDIYKDKWVYVGSMKQARCTHSAVASAEFNAIYAIGGFDEGPLQLVEKYDVMKDEWQIMAPLKHPRFMHQSVLTSL